MAKIFLDANILRDCIEERRTINLQSFTGQRLFISPLSIHILTYLYKYKIPDEKLFDAKKYFTVIDLNKDIFEKAITGPNSDFEDNIQLHSAALAECDFFLTSDKDLLKMKFFGKTQIADTLP